MISLSRTSALIERDMRKFFRSPALMMTSMVFPLLQLIVLGYAFGGKIKNVSMAFVDQDHTTESRQVREMFAGIAAGPKTFRIEDYGSETQALDDLHAGFVRGVVTVPHDFSRRFYQKDRPRIAFAEDNTDQFIASSVLERMQQMVDQSQRSQRGVASSGERGTGRGGGVSVHRVHQVLAGRVGGAFGFYRRDDRRRDHLHR